MGDHNFKARTLQYVCVHVCLFIKLYYYVYVYYVY